MSAPLSPRDRYRLGLRSALHPRRSARPYPSKGIKALWHDGNTIMLLQILIEEIRTGNRANRYFTHEDWKNILHKFHVRTGLTYNKSQIESRTNQLRSTFAKWKRLNDRATGLGFDLTSDTILADDQWWENMGREDPEILTWRFSPPKFLDLMRLCFAETFATGNDTYVPPYCASRDHIDDSQAGVEEPHNQANFTHSTPNVGPSISASNPIETCSPPSCYDYPHSKYRQISGKTQSSGDRMCDSMVEICALMKAKEQRMAALMSGDGKMKQEIDLAINLLNANQEIDKNGTFYVECLKVLDDTFRKYTFINHISKLSFSQQIYWFTLYLRDK